MAVNAFTLVTIDTATQTLTVHGFSKPELGAAGHIEVAVASKADADAGVKEPRRCQRTIPNAPTSPWSVDIPAGCPKEGAFAKGDEVYVSGFATSSDYDPFVWGSPKTIEEK